MGRFSCCFLYTPALFLTPRHPKTGRDLKLSGFTPRVEKRLLYTRLFQRIKTFPDHKIPHTFVCHRSDAFLLPIRLDETSFKAVFMRIQPHDPYFSIYFRNTFHRRFRRFGWILILPGIPPHIPTSFPQPLRMKEECFKDKDYFIVYPA